MADREREKIAYILKRNGIIDMYPVNDEFDKANFRYPSVTPDQFLTREDIVRDLINNRMSEDDKKKIIEQDTPFGGLTHSSFGRWMRNSYGFWLHNNPLTNPNAAPDDDNHPDNLSGSITREVIEWIKNPPPTHEDVDLLSVIEGAMKATQNN